MIALDLALFLQLSASATTIGASWLYGNKNVWGPGVGIFSQLFWWGIMIQSGLWGLLPVNIVMACIHVRNFRKWKNEV